MWSKEINKINKALKLWQAIGEGCGEKLHELLKSDNEKGVRVFGP